MRDDELQQWWPDLGIVVVELRRINQSTVSNLIVDAVRAGSSSSEILGGVGSVLKAHHALRSELSGFAQKAWDAVMLDIFSAFPGSRFSYWLARIANRCRRRRPRSSLRG